MILVRPPPTRLPTSKALEYPKGPYGTQIGSTIANLKFIGWSKPSDAGYDPAAFNDIHLSDFYNPDGSGPVKILWVNSSAVWCGPCNQEYAYMRDNGTWGQISQKGVVILGTLSEDAKNPPGPAKPSDLKNWGTKYEVEFPLAVDPGFKIGAYYPSDAFPTAFLVDARTMKIIDKMVGGGPGGIQEMISRIDTYLAQNG